MDEVIRILREARERLTDPQNWMKGDYWPGYRQDPFYKSAQRMREVTCYCSLGAVHVAAGEIPGHAEQGAPDQLAIGFLHEALRMQREDGTVVGGGYELVADFNDSSETTHEEVLELFDVAIAIAVARQGQQQDQQQQPTA